MPIKTGQQYIGSLRDGRRLYIDGKVVADVTAYPPLQGVIGTIAGLHDDQHDPALRDILTYVSPLPGERVSTTYLEAHTPAEFAALAGCFHLRAKRTFGLMGRLTDFMSAFLVDTAVALSALGKREAAARAEGMVELCRENDLQVTHALIDPQSDRSTLDAPSEAVQVVERRADGVVVSGCRMLSTLAPVANECYVGPYYPRRAGEEKFMLAFVVPMNTPGLTTLCRESFHRGESTFDRPLSSRFDEGDAILMFDRVLVPHERMIVDGDIEAYNGMLQARPGYTPLQATIRSILKLRFLAGLATAIARANGRDKLPRFQAAIGELIALISVAEGIRAGAIAEGFAACRSLRQGRIQDRRRRAHRTQNGRRLRRRRHQFLLPLRQHQGGRRAQDRRGLGRARHVRRRPCQPRDRTADGQMASRPQHRCQAATRAHEARLGHDRHRVRLARWALRAAILGRSRDQRAALVPERHHPRVRAAGLRAARNVTTAAIHRLARASSSAISGSTWPP